MSNPLIGITTFNGRNGNGYPTAAVMHRYIQAVAQAGAIPILIPNGLTEAVLEGLVERVDGLLFTGGGDIAIDRYGGEPNPHIVQVDESRDKMEIALANRVITSRKPFFGICRGFQLVNVALGGSLYSHIADQRPGSIKHAYDSGTERELLAHDIQVVPGTRLAEIIGSLQIKVNSLHHQGARDVASALTLSATAPDGLVEGLELADHPFGVIVQWHPEWLTGYEHARCLFSAFVEACKK